MNTTSQTEASHYKFEVLGSTVIERRRGRIVETRKFSDFAAAHDYVVQAIQMDRDFDMEGR